ncbi:contractile injection system protein, VgrG/Pvc8 family [Roseovarius sp. D0-M9]|uniref:contractile injection system protein, VgrG/Pvc8 family n=1 Tax=Roseovarius sp. D0-M9 TaxID=3127117 RepID=UPI00300FDC4E
MDFKPAFRVEVDGEDITGILVKRLISLRVSDAAGVQSDRLSIGLSDASLFDRLKEPSVGAEIKVWLGYGVRLKYMGLFIADRVEISGPPDVMNIEAVASPHGETPTGKTAITEQRSRSWPVGTRLGDLVQRVARDNGMEGAVSTSLADIALPHIDQVDESDINLLSRLARDLDAIAKPGDGKLIMAKRGESLSVAGEAMPTVPIALGDVSSWRSSRSLRETVGQVVAIWHDLGAGVPVECVAGSGKPVMRLKDRYPTREAAQRAADAEFARASRAGRAVSVTLTGNPDLVAEGLVNLSGFRSYLDGAWLVTRVEHSIDGSGYRCAVVAEPPE